MLRKLLDVREIQTKYLMGVLYDMEPKHRIFKEQENINAVLEGKKIK
jgi:hypothetical protein